MVQPNICTIGVTCLGDKNNLNDYSENQDMVTFVGLGEHMRGLLTLLVRFS